MLKNGLPGIAIYRVINQYKSHRKLCGLSGNGYAGIGSIEGVGEPLLVIDSKNWNRLLLATRGSNQAYYPQYHERYPNGQYAKPSKNWDERQNDIHGPAYQAGEEE